MSKFFTRNPSFTHEVKFIDKRGTGEHNGWKVMVQFTEDPETVFLFYSEPITPEALTEKPNSGFVDRTKVTNIKVSA